MTIEAKSKFYPLSGYENIYEIDDSGNVRSLDRIEKWGNFNRKRKGRDLLWLIDRYGYPCVKLSKNSKLKHFTIHRLVALTWIPNPENLPQINHKDGNKLNNHVSNLEWCSASHNVKHSYENNLKFGKSGADHYGSKPVIAIQDTSILEFCSVTECAKYLFVTKQAIRQSIKLNNKSKGHTISYL